MLGTFGEETLATIVETLDTAICIDESAEDCESESGDEGREMHCV
jgi:hypothetical protein